MDDKFYIKDGSFCFIIPFFTKESDICDQFFQNLKEKRKEVDANFSGDEKIKEKMRVTEVIKNEFVQNIKNANFPFIQTNFSCRFCNKEQLLYKRKHLCQCVSSAVKFHDDISQKIRNDHGILCFIKVIGDNIAVPVKETAVFSEKFTYLEAFLQEVTGASVMEILFGMEGLP